MQIKVIGLWLCVLLAGVVGAWGGLVFREASGLSVLRRESEALQSGAKIVAEEMSEPGQAGVTAQSPFGSPIALMPDESVSSLLEQADELIREASYARAIQVLQRIEQVSDAAPAEVRLKLGLCRETLHLDHEAFHDYQTVVQSSRQQALVTVAVLGQCRLWTKWGETDVAIDALSRLELKLRSCPSPRVRSRILHQLAHSRSEGALPRESDEDVLDDTSLLRIHPEVVPEEHLEELSEWSSAVQTESPFGLAITLKLDNDANAIYVRAHFQEASIQAVLDEIQMATDLRVETDAALTNVFETRTVTIDVEELPVSILLDGILSLCHCRWFMHEQTLTITPSASAREIAPGWESEQAERAAQFAIAMGPEHAWAAVSRLQQATLAVNAGHTAKAMRLLETMLATEAGSPYRGDAWTNLGKCRMLQAPDDALAAFYRALDLDPAGRQNGIASWNVGRLLLRDDQPREAVIPLRHGLVRSLGQRVTPDLALILATALVMSGEPFQANDVLRTHMDQFRSSTHQTQAAFLSSLIAYHRLTDPKQLEKAGADLLRACTNLNLEQARGEYWLYLLSVAYLELGITDEAARLKDVAAMSWPDCALLKRLREMCDQHHLQTTLTAQATHQIDVATPVDSNIRLATQLIEEERWSEAYALSRELVRREDALESERQQALQIMGQIHQQRGEHAAAIRCFSGIPPHSSEHAQGP